MADQSLIHAGFGAPERQNRWKVAFRYVLVFPHLIWLAILGIAVLVLVVIGWFAALIKGRLPRSFARFLSNYVIYQTRVYSYLWLMNDAYPPFSVKATFDVNVDIPVGNVRRLAVLFRLVLLIPAQVVNSLVSLGLAVSSVFIWLIVLVNGSMPLSLFGAVAAVLRFQARVSAYAMMITGQYPGELFGDTPVTSGDLSETSVGVLPLDETASPPPRVEPGLAVPEELAGDSVTSAIPGYDQEAEPTGAPGAPSGAPVEFTMDGSLSTPMEPPRTARLILSRGAKRILVAFLVLGVLAYAAEAVVDVNLANNESSLASLTGANHVLGVGITSDLKLRGTCTLAQSVCIDQYLTRLDGDFGTFSATVTGISFPSSARTDAARLDGDSANLISLLNQMTSGTSAITQAQSNHLQALANTFDADYSQVVADLAGSL